MDNRARSVHKRLAISLLAAAVVLSVAAGAAVFVFEYRRAESAIAERAVLAAELLRARVRTLVQQTGAPWQNVAQQALEDLAATVPRPTFGRFVVVVIRDHEGREAARLARLCAGHFPPVVLQVWPRWLSGPAPVTSTSLPRF